MANVQLVGQTAAMSPQSLPTLLLEGSSSNPCPFCSLKLAWQLPQLWKQSPRMCEIKAVTPHAIPVPRIP